MQYSIKPLNYILTFCFFLFATSSKVNYLFSDRFSVVFFLLTVDKLELSAAIDTFDAHGLRAQNDKVIDIPDMVTVLRSLYESILLAHPGAIRLQFGIDLCLNWILNVYDR